MLSLGMLAASASHAQYAFDPSAADELDKPGVLFFGAAKDENGKPIADVLVLIEDIDTNFTLVTNELGRYRAMLPVGTTMASVSASCSKPGYVAVRVAKRPGARRATGPTVQVDCLLRRTVVAP